MLSLQLDPHSALSLVEQIRQGLAALIEQRVLRPGAKLPSVRALAQQLAVSKFTVSDAYDRLAALGYLQPQAGSGFYVSRLLARLEPRGAGAGSSATGHFDHLWLSRQQLTSDAQLSNISGGGLPSDWDDQSLMRRALRQVASHARAALGDYGDPFGYLPLREMVQLRLSAMGLRVPPPQIVLTHGATHALELVIRRLLKPGDKVLVEDPGYCSLFGNLQLQGITMLGVPRLADGPDLQALDLLAAEHCPKLFFVQSLMHNPTGSSLLPATAHRLLQLAAQHGFRLVELDFYADLASPLQTRLATLDHLERVIYIGALSKTMLGPVRLGYLACDPALATELANVKLLSSVTSAQLNERLAYQVLTDKACRKHLDLITQRLQACTAAGIRQLETHGFVLHSEPRCGKYLWARHPAHASAETLAAQARACGLLLAPGRVFRPEHGDTPWFRLNVAQTEQPAWQDWLAQGLFTSARS